MKSEFYEIDSLDAFDYRPVDLSGALEVVIVVDGDSFITNEPNDASPRLPLRATDPPLIVHSTDDRLFFVSNDGNAKKARIWVIRRR